MTDIRRHSSDDMAGPEFEHTVEPVAVVIRPDGSVDAYGYIAVIDQRPAADAEWEVLPGPPAIVTAANAQQAADEALRLTLEDASGDGDPNPRVWVRRAGTQDPYEVVYPAVPPLIALDGGARPGPGQAPDNWVYEMRCGHTYDSPAELTPIGDPRNLIPPVRRCSLDGEQELSLRLDKDGNPLFTGDQVIHLAEISAGLWTIQGLSVFAGRPCVTLSRDGQRHPLVTLPDSVQLKVRRG